MADQIAIELDRIIVQFPPDLRVVFEAAKPALLDHAALFLAEGDSPTIALVKAIDSYIEVIGWYVEGEEPKP